MWCKFGRATPQNVGSTKSSTYTKWDLRNLRQRNLRSHRVPPTPVCTATFQGLAHFTQNGPSLPRPQWGSFYTGPSLIRTPPLLGPYSRNKLRVLRWSYGEWVFLMSEVPLYPAPFLWAASILSRAGSGVRPLRARIILLQGYLAHKKTPTPLGPP